MRYLDRPRSSDSLVLTACLGGVSVFQAALAAGAPWGALAYGGGHPGVVPAGLRATSAVAALVWGGLAVAVHLERPRSPIGRLVMLRALTATASAGAVVNLASPSLPERFLWVPVTSAIAVTAWRESGRTRQRRGGAARTEGGGDPLSAGVAVHVGSGGSPRPPGP